MSNIFDLEALAEIVRRASGISLRPDRYDALEASVARAFPGVELPDLLGALGAGGELLDRLLDEVAVKETTFLRDRYQLDRIDWRALFDRARERGEREVAVWCAGCATGEEAYSLALLAWEAFAPTVPPVKIIATDLSGTALDQAGTGRYRERALWAVDDALRDRYFTVDDRGYLVGDALRQLVRFQRHNFVANPAPPDGADRYSVIICRNVFIYFEPETANQTLAMFRGLLAPGGELVIGAADALVGGHAFGAYEQAIEREVAAKSLRPSRRAPQGKPVRSRPAAVGPAATKPGVTDALEAASNGNLDLALARAEALLAADPLDPAAQFVRGQIELSSGRPARAIEAFRAALYADPKFAIAAFMLGRAHDECDAHREALRAYELALRIFDRGDRRYEYLLEQLEIHDVADACRLRLAAASKIGRPVAMAPAETGPRRP